MIQFKKGTIVEVTEDHECNCYQFKKGERYTVTKFDPDGFYKLWLDLKKHPNHKEGYSQVVSERRFNAVSKKAVKTATKRGVSLDSVVLSADKKKQIKAAISQQKHTDLIFETWGFGEVFEKGTAISLLFYGPPGTGKTLTAQAIADELGLTLKIIQSGEVESSEPGQCERNIKAFFENAEQQKQLLLFDECDSLICDRNEVGMILGAQINALLTSLERYTGVVVFTTNRLGKMDPAFERRVSAKVEFSLPDEDQRRAIWKRLIPKKAPLDKDVNFDQLAKFPLPGGNIKNAVLNAARFAAFSGKKKIDEECFVHGIEKEMEALKQFEAAFRSRPSIPRPGVDLTPSHSPSIDVSPQMP